MTATEWKTGYTPGNGTEGDMFRAAFCDKCVNDHGVLDCDIFMQGLLGERPVEWEQRTDELGHFAARCTAFEAIA